MQWLWLPTLLAAAFALATTLEPAFRQWSHRKAPPRGVLEALMGDSRRLFANHFFIQSDVYLHSGYYPSIFDRQEDDAHKDRASQALCGQAHSSTEHEHDERCSHDVAGQPRNWLDAFGRHFYPSSHTHLGESEAGRAEAREILPWIKFAADLDPSRLDTYTVGASWLRQMGRKDEALRFLRQGLRHVPTSYEILFQLGVCCEDQNDPTRARNLWELALRRWQDQQADAPDPDRLAAAQILTHLARLEVRQGQRDRAVAYLQTLLKYSATPDQVKRRIAEVQAGLPFEADAKP